MIEFWHQSQSPFPHQEHFRGTAFDTWAAQMKNKSTSGLLMSVFVQGDWRSDTASRCKLAALKASVTTVIISSDWLVTSCPCPVEWGGTASLQLIWNLCCRCLIASAAFVHDCKSAPSNTTTVPTRVLLSHGFVGNLHWSLPMLSFAALPVLFVVMILKALAPK